MAIQNILNVTGLSVGMIGAYLMFYFTPKADSGTWLYQREELEELRKKDAYKNKMVRFGMLLLAIGFVFQLAALFTQG
jgi:hypothetical protein